MGTQSRLSNRNEEKKKKGQKWFWTKSVKMNVDVRNSERNDHRKGVGRL